MTRPAPWQSMPVGNVVVTGYSIGLVGLSVDYATIKYSSAGVPLWTNRFVGGGGYTRPTALALDSSGNIFVTGYSTNSATGNDYATVCYSSVGALLWTNSYDAPTHSEDKPTAIVVDDNNDVIVTGTATTVTYTTSDAHFLTIKYSNAGLPLWTNAFRWNGALGGASDAPKALAVDVSGNVFVGGSSSSIFGGGSYYENVAYSSPGVPLWTNRSTVSGVASAMTLDGDGGLLMTGYTAPPAEDYLTIKYMLPSPPRLLCQTGTNQLILSWIDSTFALQTAGSLTETFTNIPGATSPYTNSVSNVQQFFRLISN